MMLRPHGVEQMSDEEILKKLPRDDAIEVLLNRYENYLHRLAQSIWEKTLGRNFVPLEDLVSTARLGLVIAVNTYNPAKKSLFRTFLVHVVNRLLLKEIAHYMPVTFGRWDKSDEEKEEFARLLNSIVGWEEASHDEADEHGPISIEDIPDQQGEEELEALVNRWLIRSSILRLPPLERQVITMAYGLNGDPMTFSQIARILGYSVTHIKNIHKRAIERLKGWLS